MRLSSLVVAISLLSVSSLFAQHSTTSSTPPSAPAAAAQQSRSGQHACNPFHSYARAGAQFSAESCLNPLFGLGREQNGVSAPRLRTRQREQNRRLAARW
jgi:hypothetical protein